jgi:NADH-quinone oxidoreductase subunit C
MSSEQTPAPNASPGAPSVGAPSAGVSPPDARQPGPFDALMARVSSGLGEILTGYEVAHDELTVHVRRDDIVAALTFLRDDPSARCEQLIDICGVDWPERAERFDVVYQLLSLKHNRRIRVKLRTDEDKPVPSCTGVYKTAGWLEREVWDMYGVYFSGHADLRRILTDYGFDGHPQRKDFPLSGYVELRYDSELKRTVYSPVQFVQDFRRFDFTSPWEGMMDIQLPGDEKAVKPVHGWREGTSSDELKRGAK